MAAVAGPRPLHGDIEVELASGIAICGHVLLPTGIVEVGDKNGGLTVFIGHIEPHDIAQAVIGSPEMGDQHLVGEGLEVAIGAMGAQTGAFALCRVGLGANVCFPFI